MGCGASGVSRVANEISRQLEYPRGEAYALRGLAAVKNAKGRSKRRPADARTSNSLATADAGRAPQRADSVGARRRPCISCAADRRRVSALEIALAGVSPGRFAERAASDLWRARGGALRHGQLARRLRSSAQCAGNLRSGMCRNQVDQRFATLKVELRHRRQGKRERLCCRSVRTTPTSWPWPKASARAICKER